MIGFGPPAVYVLAHSQGVLVRGPGDRDRADAGDRARPGEVAVDEQIAVALGALDHVLRRNPRVVERDLEVRRGALAQRADVAVGDARRAALDDDRRQALGAAAVRIGAADDEVQVRALVVPAADVAGPVLLAVQDVLVAVQRRRHTHARAPDGGSVEVRGSARRAGGLACRVADDELVARVTGRAADEPLLLVLGAVVPHRHEPETVDEDGRAEAGIDRLDLLGRDHEVDVGQPAAAVLLGEHRPGDALPAGLLVGRLEHLPAGERIGLGVDLRRQRSEDLLGEAPRHRLEFLLLLRQGEINRHALLSFLGTAAAAKPWTHEPGKGRQSTGGRERVDVSRSKPAATGRRDDSPRGAPPRRQVDRDHHSWPSLHRSNGNRHRPCSQLDQPTTGLSTHPLYNIPAGQPRPAAAYTASRR